VSELALACCVDGWSRLAPADFLGLIQENRASILRGSHCKLLPTEPERSQDGLLYGDFSKRTSFFRDVIRRVPRFQESIGPP